ncbi:MAG TPA: hypothetical protein PKI99_00990 [Terrimesophilobacter sp.]|nr:hypothetical protein [Terrimesophilobacter sp.]
MKLSPRTAAPILFAAFFTTFSLAGCTPPADSDDRPGDDGSSSEQDPCFVGSWNLDVADYSTQSESYMRGLGLSIEGFAMDGAGTIRFTADGLVATDIDLTTSGTIVAGDTSVPLNSRSGYSATGDWSVGDGASINLANWSNVPDPGIPVDPGAPQIPAVDYTDIPAITANCTATTLVLQAPDAPLSARWTR